MEKKRKKRKTFDEDNGFAQFGGYMAAKRSKLSKQFNASTSCMVSNIFEGVSISVNGYTIPTADELKQLIADHGGVYHHYHSRTKTTHMIASILPHTKIKNLRDQKVVKPEWITDSIQAGRLLSYSKYLLYNPGFLQGQTKLGFSTAEVESAETSDVLDSKPEELSEAHTNKFESDSNPILTQKLILDSSDEIESNNNLKSSDISDGESHELLGNASSVNKGVILEKSEACVDNTEALETSEEPEQLRPEQETIEQQKVPDPPKRSAGKAGDSNFLSEFYSHSRLHHISTAGSEFKEYVRQLQTQHEGVFLGRDLLKKEIQDMNLLESGDDWTKHKVIMHIDMDCFFVSVGLLKRPDLIGKPVAVTHSRGNAVPHREGVDVQFEINYYQSKRDTGSRSKLNKSDNLPTEHNIPVDYLPRETLGSTSEISSASYEARKAGVSSGMFLGEALKRCPELQTIPYDFEGYTKASKILYETLVSYTLQVEAISCDEMFVDCTDILEHCATSPMVFAQHLRKQIQVKTGCTASAGLGSNFLIARLATRLAKPNGQWYVPPAENASFMLSQSVRSLPGVGHSLGGHLRSLGVENCEQLQGFSLEKLQKEFGTKTGKNLYDQCRGIDNRTIITEKERKSVSAEINYGMRFEKIEEAEKFLKEIAEEVEKRLKKAEKVGTHVTLKLKIRSKDAPVETAKFLGHGVCDNVARSLQLTLPVDSGQMISKECCALLRNMKVPASDIRGMGIQVSRLSSAKSKQNIRTIENFLLNQPSGSKMVTLKEDSERPFSGSVQECVNTTRKVPNLASEREWFPSPSQIDPDVWLALPKEIQSQLSSEYKSLSSNKVQGPQETTSKKTSFKSSLPHYSQLDASVLDALPDDIRHELLEAYSSKAQKSTVSPVRNKTKKSPVKSPGRKRPYKRKLHVSPNKKIQSATNKEKVMSPAKQPHPVVVTVPEKRKEVFKASLCGATDIADVRPLMKEWIFSTQTPINDDVQFFSKFIQDIILEKNLEKLDLVVKSFFRNITLSQNKEWEPVYKRIIDEMQLCIKGAYGFPLKVPHFV